MLIESKENAEKVAPDFSVSSVNLSNDNVDEVLTAHRKSVKDYYISHNEAVADELCLDDYRYVISFYSPYIEIIFDDIDEFALYEEDIIESINNNSEILVTVNNYAVYDSSTEVTVNTSSGEEYTLEQAFEDIGVNNTTYTGNGVNVGIIDAGVPQSTDNMKPGLYTMLDSTTNLHSYVISSIIGGTSGIAENVHFYCTIGYSLINCCNTLIDDYNVNVINISLGYSENRYGYYTYMDACIDKIISNSGCTIVKSAGNQSNKPTNTYYVTAPGCAMNIITVGSIDKNKSISNFSSWLTNNDFVLKPDVVTPGGNLWDIDNIDNIYQVGDGWGVGHSGTSYAAPMVVGTIALLMEEFPLLKTNAALVKSVVQMGSEKLPSQTDYYEQKAGFGLINYPKMRECMQNGQCFSFSMPSEGRMGDLFYSQTITIPYETRIEINANLIVNSTTSSFIDAMTFPVYTPYVIRLYDLTTSQYVAFSTVESSVDYLTYFNTSTTSSQFRIEIMFQEDNISGEFELCAVAYDIINEHVHSYGQYYTPNNKITHWSHCDCGSKVTQAHVMVSMGSGSNKYCKYCGEPALIGPGVLNGVYTDLPHTENGSYILPNGIIVLVPEDEEAFFNGTLEFRTGEVM